MCCGGSRSAKPDRLAAVPEQAVGDFNYLSSFLREPLDLNVTLTPLISFCQGKTPGLPFVKFVDILRRGIVFSTVVRGCLMP